MTFATVAVAAGHWSLRRGLPDAVSGQTRTACQRELLGANAAGKITGRPVTDKEVIAFFEGYGEWRGLGSNFYPWKTDEPAY